MKIAVVGTGYVGLVAGTCFAESGNEVTCVDVDERKVRALQEGRVPIYEPGLEELLHRNSAAHRLHFTTDLGKAVSSAQVVFIAVGTPEGESGDADLQYVLAAAEGIGKAMKQYTVVVDKSTVPVGTADKVRETISKVTSVEFDVVSNPEFLKEGAALEDFLKPDRVVIGTSSERARRIMGELYAPFVRTENPILFMDARSAELTKYAANAMLATRISFMNDVAALCEKVGADVEFVRKGLGSDKRIGYPFLHPGCGYGGSCFPKDVKALVATAREFGLELDLLRAVERTNARQKRSLLAKALRHYGDVADRTFAVWGLAFKPKTDDMREAPAVELIEGLLGKGARVQVHDPVAAKVAERYFGNRVLYAPSNYAAAEGADGLFLVTEWNEFRRPDFKKLKSLMKEHVIFDGRNIFDPVRVKEEGFAYYGIGRS
ncbi:UDP-glucose/GDP-mannose dehydrogenase family protein [Pyxidicoccus fallax]|uniref:UDP-glucose 6-dehydrogenase n=1 Tax=Pyxidicoccus fallax TaxID=394095 RepID=A0A848LBT8_9BACT|nr:UDP-glucose/GDP-mannose dehydrogenase family protein [Pyxidicoccus fallax]NMO15946.1 UDP-glucose/GDP-mannose dehydrogenase family protein [Pyxidicoccus fallax]NPC81968.1 UDP-glucose/GDP-mannose dehydrogenase family protein [Pyxidicoccus fallax]